MHDALACGIYFWCCMPQSDSTVNWPPCLRDIRTIYLGRSICANNLTICNIAQEYEERATLAAPYVCLFLDVR